MHLLKKAIIPAAGVGTRLLPSTKEQPKEMLPVFSRDSRGTLCVKPLVQIIFEQIYEAGFRDFCFVVGRGKRSIEDHFTLDKGFLDYLESKNKTEMARDLEIFYGIVKTSRIYFVNQDTPRGFGDAVLKAELFTGNDPFLVHAGDDIVISRMGHVSRLVEAFEKYCVDAVLCLDKLRDPRKYGVAVVKGIEKDVYQIQRLVEKPSHPPSNFAVVATYIFRPTIYEAIRSIPPDRDGEVQLTDAIQYLIERGSSVFGIELGPSGRRLDIGNPESYWKTLNILRHAKYYGLKRCLNNCNKERLL